MLDDTAEVRSPRTPPERRRAMNSAAERATARWLVAPCGAYRWTRP
ncbi:hypothetical protein [Kocuria marina]|nr:hypothetical protein [Kocuria marina]